MADIETPALRQSLATAPAPQFLWDRSASVRFTDLDRGTSLGGRLGELMGRSVLLATQSQLTSALVLIELDGIARRFVVLPPDADPAHLSAIIAAAEIDAVVIDDASPRRAEFDLAVRVHCTPAIAPVNASPPLGSRTAWVLATSGTTGVPKLVAHDLGGLTAAMRVHSPADGATAWGTFYDIRRYGGLQIFLRAVLGGASLVLSHAGEPLDEHLQRLAEHGVTHLSGTPSHWRRALMNPAIRNIPLRYIRLSGEIADQAILDRLRAVFPEAVVAHAYASTEAGVGFDVNDGLAGFPAAYVGSIRDGVELKIEDGSLYIRSRGTASGYVGSRQRFANADGFVETGDIVERRGERYYFAGRKGGIINIGGLKVHPEEVEAVINRHPQVRMSLVHRKQSPITGSIVVADVVLTSQDEGARQVEVRDDILKLCREALPRHKVPTTISFVPALGLGASGKLARRGR
jgi:acyl-coenzyme A synthetase/AMP-(fatty) acid ligase